MARCSSVIIWKFSSLPEEWKTAILGWMENRKHSPAINCHYLFHVLSLQSLTVADPAPLGVTPGGAGVGPEHIPLRVLHHQDCGPLVHHPGHQLLKWQQIIWLFVHQRLSKKHKLEYLQVAYKTVLCLATAFNHSLVFGTPCN